MRKQLPTIVYANPQVAVDVAPLGEGEAPSMQAQFGTSSR